MGSISGLKSNLLLVRTVHLQHDGSKQPEHNNLLLIKMLLMNTIAIEHNIQVVGTVAGD